MHDLCDFAMFCLKFYTLFIICGLTINSVHPVATSSFSAVFVFQVFRPLKVPNKFRKNTIKNQRPGSFPNHQEGKGADPPGPQEGPWRGPTLGRARRPPGCPMAPLSSPLCLYLPPVMETPIIDLLF